MALCHAPYDGIIRIRFRLRPRLALRVKETSILLSADFRVSTPVVFFQFHSTTTDSNCQDNNNYIVKK